MQLIHNKNQSATMKEKAAKTIRVMWKTSRMICLKMMLTSSHHLIAHPDMAVEMPADQRTLMEPAKANFKAWWSLHKEVSTMAATKRPSPLTHPLLRWPIQVHEAAAQHVWTSKPATMNSKRKEPRRGRSQKSLRRLALGESSIMEC